MAEVIQTNSDLWRALVSSPSALVVGKWTATVSAEKSTPWLRLAERYRRHHWPRCPVSALQEERLDCSALWHPSLRRTKEWLSISRADLLEQGL